MPVLLCGVSFLALRNDIELKIASYHKGNKNPYDLFDPSKPDYIGSPEALAPYQKSIPESIADYTARMRAALPPPRPPPGKPAGARPPLDSFLSDGPATRAPVDSLATVPASGLATD